MTISKSALITEYLEHKQLSALHKRKENELRIKIIEQFFPNAGEGTHTELFKEWEIRGGIRYNYKIDEAALADVEHLLTDSEKSCIKRKPELALGVYRKLDDDERKNVDEFVTIKPGLPTLSIDEYYD